MNQTRRFHPAGLLHGADYNPDQWLLYPEILAEDAPLMKEAGFNSVSLFIFGWATLEPREGEFQFDPLDQAFERLHAHGIRIQLSTPSSGIPVWLSRRNEEVRRVSATGQRAPVGGRMNFCPNSPMFRERVRVINRELAARYAGHPALLSWHVTNELSGECYCELCLAKFREWLHIRYKNIAELNHGWWTPFWGHIFSDFEDIVAIDSSCGGMLLDWKRFQSDSHVEYLRNEISALREFHPEVPVTTNFVPTCRVPEQRRIAAEVDYVSWDAYPDWHVQSDDAVVASNNAFLHDLYRTMAGDRPMIQMETTPSQVNWAADSPVKRPGVHRLTVLQALAHGADGVLYFQWRAGRGGCEQFFGAVMDHTNTKDTRTFRDVAAVGAEMRSLDDLVGQAVKSSVGLVFDWDSLWAVESAPLVGNRAKDYEPTCVAQHRAFWNQSISVDVVGCGDDLSGYQLVVAPMLYVLDNTRAAWIREWVKEGGVLVLTYYSGVVDLGARAHLGGIPGPLRDLAGLWVECVDALPAGRAPRIIPTDGSSLADDFVGHCRDYASLIRLEGAEVHAVYGDEFYAGSPALTRHPFGKGECWFQAARMDDSALMAFYRELSEKHGIAPVRRQLPPGVTASRRGDTIFTMNWNPTPVAGLEAYGCEVTRLND